MTPTEREALIKVRNGLASGEYVHARSRRSKKGKRVFNMDVTHSPCGTAACIGGWMAMDMGMEVGDEVDLYVCEGGHEEDLYNLFFPDDDFGGSYSLITPQQAVHAIDNFLKDGDPRWEEIFND